MPSATTAPASSSDPSARELTESTYADAATLEARFTVRRTFGDSERGHVTFARPNKMRWSFDVPQGKLVVCDGKTLWTYDPKAHSAMKWSSEAAVWRSPWLYALAFARESGFGVFDDVASTDLRSSKQGGSFAYRIDGFISELKREGDAIVMLDSEVSFFLDDSLRVKEVVIRGALVGGLLAEQTYQFEDIATGAGVPDTTFSLPNPTGAGSPGASM